MGLRPVLFWDFTECRVVIAKERGAHLHHSGVPEMMLDSSEVIIISIREG
jgi:hypothetical protein